MENNRLTHLATEIEAFMFERGEYDYPKEKLITWLRPSEMQLSKWREKVTRNIFDSLTQPKGITVLADYLSEELYVMDKDDELFQKAENHLKHINRLIYSKGEQKQQSSVKTNKFNIERD